MNRLLKYLIFAAVAFSANVSINADTQNLPTVEILGKNYYVYKAAKGESLFNIARSNGWDYTLVQTLNPKAISPLTKGLKIYYPAPDSVKGNQVAVEYEDAENSVDNSETPQLYTIKRGDTLYSLAKRYNTTVAAILKMNPGVSESNFKADAVIKLPQSGTGLKRVEKRIEQEKLSSFESYKVEKNDTWESIASKTGLDAKDLQDFNPEAGAKPKNKTLITVPKINTVEVDTVVVYEDPRETSLGGVNEIYADVHGINDSIAFEGPKIVVLLSEPTSKKDLEFTRGVLTGLDNLKRSDIAVNLTVMDGNRNSTDVLSDLADLNPDIVFLTSDKGIPAYLSEYAEISQTPMVNTFDVKNELFATNPYVIQLLTPTQYMNDGVSSSLRESYGDYTLIFVGDADNSDLLAKDIRLDWPSGKVKNLSVEGLKQANFKADGKFLFYVQAQKKDDVNEITTIVSNIRSKYPVADIATIGRPGWIVYEESLGEKFHSSNVTIPSRFFYDGDSPSARTFKGKYRGLFNREPSMSYPLYAGVGYDCINFFIPELVKTKGDLNTFSPFADGVQNDLELKRIDNWTGLINPTVYLVRFTPYGTIDKTVIK